MYRTGGKKTDKRSSLCTGGKVDPEQIPLRSRSMIEMDLEIAAKLCFERIRSAAPTPSNSPFESRRSRAHEVASGHLIPIQTASWTLTRDTRYMHQDLWPYDMRAIAIPRNSISSPVKDVSRCGVSRPAGERSGKHDQRKQSSDKSCGKCGDKQRMGSKTGPMRCAEKTQRGRKEDACMPARIYGTTVNKIEGRRRERETRILCQLQVSICAP